MSENSAGPWPCAYPGNHVYRRQDFAARANNHEGQELIEEEASNNVVEMGK